MTDAKADYAAPPYFLFRTLNAISALMHTDVDRADRMLARVSELLRIAGPSRPWTSILLARSPGAPEPRVPKAQRSEI